MVQATTLENCDRIVVFTDSLAAARSAVDPSVHSGQNHSLAVCRVLSKWLASDEAHHIEFVQTPSKLQWGLQHKAHEHARSLPPVPAGRRPATSLDSVCKKITQSALDEWQTLFLSPEYRGRNFLPLEDTLGAQLRPVYANGGTWLHSVDNDNKACARLCRSVLNHAPIGEYYSRFNIQEETACTCGVDIQS